MKLPSYVIQNFVSFDSSAIFSLKHQQQTTTTTTMIKKWYITRYAYKKLSKNYNVLFTLVLMELKLKMYAKTGRFVDIAQFLFCIVFIKIKVAHARKDIFYLCKGK